MRTKEEINNKIGSVVKNLKVYHTKEKVISDMAIGFIDALTWVLGQESTLDNLAAGNTFDKK